jgi:integrase
MEQVLEHASNRLVDPRVIVSLSKNELEHWIKVLSKEKLRRYRQKNHSYKKYGNLNKGFVQEELDEFFLHCDHSTAKLAFQLMAYLGLRVGEVVKIRLCDINLADRRILIHTEKAHTADSMYLHDAVYEVLRCWIRTHRTTILSHDQFLIFSDKGARKYQRWIENDLRIEFRRVAVRAGLNESYDVSDERYDKVPRRLFRLTTHSFRHYFCTKVFRSCKDPVICQRLMRHQKFSSTQVYLNTGVDILDAALKNTFA